MVFDTLKVNLYKYFSWSLQSDTQYAANVQKCERVCVCVCGCYLDLHVCVCVRIKLWKVI